MKPLPNSYNSYEFTVEEKEVIKTYLSSPEMRAYLESTYAQMRDEILRNLATPYESDPDKEYAIVSFIAGAEEYLTQVLRIGE